MNAEFIRQIASGKFADFLNEKSEDYRMDKLGITHVADMLASAIENAQVIQEKYRNEIAGEEKSRGPKHSNRQH